MIRFHTTSMPCRQQVQQESPADARATRDSAATCLKFENTNFGENFNFKVIQGHRPWCQLKVHMQLPIGH